MEHEWHAGFIDLVALEIASTEAFVKQWHEIGSDRREGRIDHFVLTMGDGTPVAAYIVQPFILVVHDLDNAVFKMVMLDSVGPNVSLEKPSCHFTYLTVNSTVRSPVPPTSHESQAGPCHPNTEG